MMKNEKCDGIFLQHLKSKLNRTLTIHFFSRGTSFFVKADTISALHFFCAFYVDGVDKHRRFCGEWKYLIFTVSGTVYILAFSVWLSIFFLALSRSMFIFLTKKPTAAYLNLYQTCSITVVMNEKINQFFSTQGSQERHADYYIFR